MNHSPPPRSRSSSSHRASRPSGQTSHKSDIRRDGGVKNSSAGKTERRADPVRDLAFDIICGVMERRVMLETSLAKSTVTEGRDRAAGHRLAAATLRHWGSMNELVRPFLRREPPENVRVALLMGIAQLLYLDTPPHAAVGTIIDLLHRRKLSAFSGLANAVLRRIAREGAGLREGLDEARLDVPPWLWSAWGQRARAITRGFYQEAPLDLTARQGAITPQDLLQIFLKDTAAAPQEAESNGQALSQISQGVTQGVPQGHILPNGTIRLPAGTKITSLPGFEEGLFWAQDVAASLPVRLMGSVKGRNIVDFCAAPGGKTAQLVAAGARVVALEHAPVRAQRLKENLDRLRLSAEIVVEDALKWPCMTKQAQIKPDAVLLDAPCSATGTFRRHPDVLWLKKPRDIRSLTGMQDQLIDKAADILPQGGMLLYAVCSLQDEEGPQRIEAALARGGWRVEPFTVDELAFLPEARTEEGYLRTHPGLWHELGGMDGFFAARLIKI